MARVGDGSDEEMRAARANGEKARAEVDRLKARSRAGPGRAER